MCNVDYWTMSMRLSAHDRSTGVVLLFLTKMCLQGFTTPNFFLLLRRGGTPGEKGKIGKAGRPPGYFWRTILCTNERICDSTERSYCNVLQPGLVLTAPDLHSTAVASIII
ncbi:hypothetical protein ASPVEDRAFT_42731 [Aspergillus versicolor CBS 583.65]|uniref:Uncharacterized protein n=1 Tax=Aspergillus versicolor CBS 583.65 TaxID=1036611 RepID=A0A1L9PP20_ASPVE|nr:uncharacterized protein ASPVEDRAFT_42731 [Aspergillus versicolor CBS 583.65]OJJ03222.1 hypothetical protein ASPVEDRAFT_42731 [Aspergillus versicolor CBS 583.65]